MVQTWPNPRAAAAATETDQTSIEPNSKELMRGYLAHAQVMIGIGLCQLAVIVPRSGGDAVSTIDYDKFPNAYNFAMFSLNASALLMLAISGLGGLIFWTSKSFDLDSRIREAIMPFSKKNPKRLGWLLFFALFALASLFALSRLFWLHSENMITKGMYSAGLDLFSILMATCCFVYAVVQIRQALKLMSEKQEA